MGKKEQLEKCKKTLSMYMEDPEWWDAKETLSPYEHRKDLQFLLAELTAWKEIAEELSDALETQKATIARIEKELKSSEERRDWLQKEMNKIIPLSFSYREALETIIQRMESANLEGGWLNEAKQALGQKEKE